MILPAFQRHCDPSHDSLFHLWSSESLSAGSVQSHVIGLRYSRPSYARFTLLHSATLHEPEGGWARFLCCLVRCILLHTQVTGWGEPPPPKTSLVPIYYYQWNVHLVHESSQSHMLLERLLSEASALPIDFASGAKTQARLEKLFAFLSETGFPVNCLPPESSCLQKYFGVTFYNVCEPSVGQCGAMLPFDVTHVWTITWTILLNDSKAINLWLNWCMF
jgi:hypothetical protein